VVVNCHSGALSHQTVFGRADFRVRHPVEVGRHAGIAGGKRKSEHETRLRAAGVTGRSGDGKESGRRRDQEGSCSRYAATRRAAYTNTVSVLELGADVKCQVARCLARLCR